jgi:hypothetical protein
LFRIKKRFTFALPIGRETGVSLGEVRRGENERRNSSLKNIKKVRREED